MKILEIEINTDNLSETTNFYSKILGLKLIKNDKYSVSFVAGHTTLTFIESNNIKPKYHFAFNIPHNKLDEAIGWAKSKFPLLEVPGNGVIAHFESWNAKSIYFYDNNENILEFIARYDLDNATKLSFDESIIISISEIGVVTDLPLLTAQNLIEKYNITYFEKGTQSNDFLKLGNDDGLIIIAETNRSWFPTEQKSEKHFTRVKVSADGTIREIVLNDTEKNYNRRNNFN